MQEEKKKQDPQIRKELNNMIGRKEIKPNYKILRSLEFQRKKKLTKNGQFKQCKDHPFCERILMINDTIPKRDKTYVFRKGVKLKKKK